jgi:hypothetical protein
MWLKMALWESPWYDSAFWGVSVRMHAHTPKCGTLTCTPGTVRQDGVHQAQRGASVTKYPGDP